MAKYKLKVEGVSNVTPNNKGFIDNVDPTEVYYDSETNTIMLGDGTITEAEPDLTPGITPSDGDVLAYNSTSSQWENTNEINPTKVSMNDAAGIVIEGEYIKSKAYADGDDTQTYIDMYEDCFDIYTGNTDFCLYPTGGYLMVTPEDNIRRTIGIRNLTGIYFNQGNYYLNFNLGSLSNDRTITIPDADGTLALTSDIVPYTPTDENIVTGETFDDVKINLSETTIIPNNTIRTYRIKGICVGNEGNKASYTGTPAGCSTPITLTANYGGNITSIVITGNGTTIDQTITTWNNTYSKLDPTRTLSLTSGDGNQYISDRVDVALINGTDDYKCASYDIVGTIKNINETLTIRKGTNTEINDELTITGMDTDVNSTGLVISVTGKAYTKINWSAKVEWHDLAIA